MKIKEVLLDQATFKGADSFQVAAVAPEHCSGRDDCIELRLPSCPALHLIAVVDVSEQLDRPRVFYGQSAATTSVLLFGGERAYKVSSKGEIEYSLTLFRQVGDAEYWTMQNIDHDAETWPRTGLCGNRRADLETRSSQESEVWNSGTNREG